MKRLRETGDAHTLVMASIVVVIIGILSYAGVNSYFSHQAPEVKPVQTEVPTKSVEAGDIGIMMSKVKMEMSKSEVDATIGVPFECSIDIPGEEKDSQYDLDQCKYGDKNAEGYVNVSYMNGRVWGTSYVKKSAQ